MDCFNCNKISIDRSVEFSAENFAQNYKINKPICGSCREVLKVDLVYAVLKLDRVYLSETKRNKKGRPQALTPDEKYEVKERYEHPENLQKESYQQIADNLGVSKTTIFKAVKGNKY